MSRLQQYGAMSRTSLFAWTVLAAGVTFGAGPAVAAAPTLPAGVQRIELTTGDGVELVARYRPGTQGNRSPAVLILDRIGEDRRPQVCDAIATELQKAGCATLCFDFRGHGASTAVTEAFWDDPTNRKSVRGYRPTAVPERIVFGDFRADYFRPLVNDIATARAFLDTRNDAGECNAGHLIVVGLGEGASLGAMWAATEWSRHRITGGFQPRLASNPEGRDILGCIWIDPVLRHERHTLPVFDCVKRATEKRTTYVGLIHSAGDGQQTRLASQCKEALNKRAHLFQATAVRTRDGKGILDDPKVVATVAAVFAQMWKVQDPAPWDDRDFADKRFAWALPGGGTVLAKEEDERTLRPVPIDRLIAR